MLETGMSGLMSGEVKRSDAEGQSHRALPRLYNSGPPDNKAYPVDSGSPTSCVFAELNM